MSLITTSSAFPGSSFEDYRQRFPYQGDNLYRVLFARNQSRIKIKKADVAATNLRKIFDAAFSLSAKTSFHNMSLRDLSRETGVSMGGLYSCLARKEDIAMMVLDIVELITEENNAKALAEPDELISLEMAIKYHLYASTLLQPWFFFLYFETRSLSPVDQQRSKNIELNSIAMFETKIQQGLDNGHFTVRSPYFVAQTILIALQDWYLKPWKNKEKHIDREQYSVYLFNMVKKLLVLAEPSSS